VTSLRAWSRPSFEIQRIVPFGGKMIVEGVGLQSRRLVKRPLTLEEIVSLVKIRGQQHTFDGDAGLFLLGAEAERIRIAHQFDPLFAVNSSIVDPPGRTVPVLQLRPSLLLLSCAVG
jgi:hypothetical protein